jgi:putative ABC transport system permease protein
VNVTSKNKENNLWKPWYTFQGVLALILKRQRHYIGLTLLVLLVIVLAVGLMSNASFFAQAVDRIILNQELENFSRVTGRPPFSTSAYIYPSSRNPIMLEDAERLGNHVAGTLSGEVGLPLQHLGLQISSGGMMLQSAVESVTYGSDQANLGSVEVTFVANISEKMEIIEGDVLDEGNESRDVLDVWMHNVLAQEMGIHVGETLKIGISLAHKSIPVRLVGFWQAIDPDDDFWFGNPDSDLKDVLLVRRQDYVNFIQPMFSGGSRSVNWYIILDDSKLLTRDISNYLEGFHYGLAVINKYIPGARFNAPPLDPLASYVQRNEILTVMLLGYNLPAIFILLYFLILTATIVAQWQRREIAVLVSRGFSIWNVSSLSLIEQLLLCLFGLPLGIVFGMLIARMIGYSSSFLIFTERSPLPVSTEGINFPLVLSTLGIMLLARFFPTLQAAGKSLLVENRERARPTHNPFWYRYYLDLLLVLPTYYAYDQLNKQGSLTALITDRPSDLYQDPLLILVPALFMLTASLIAMRVFPFLMQIFDVFANLTPWLSIHLALRQLGRRGGDYIRPLLLVIITLAMGVYTLSMATSLDQWLIDRVYYQVGADMTFSYRRSNQGEGSPFSGEDVQLNNQGWILLSRQLQNINGVSGVTRLGDYQSRILLGSPGETWGRFLAIDRLDHPLVAWFRSDFAEESLGSLMNRLAISNNAVLVSQNFLSSHNYNIGDQISARVNVSPVYHVQSDFEIVGTYDFFPTVYEDEIPAIIGNMEYLTLLSGAPIGHTVWLTLEPGVNRDLIQDQVLNVMRSEDGIIQDSQAIIAEEQAALERVGIYGTLSVGFLSAAFMAILALLIYSYASLKDRVYHFDVLHAVGLTRGQIITQVIIEYSFLTIFGALAGAAIGHLTSRFFVPFFRYTGELQVPLPPLIPIIAENTMWILISSFTVLVILAEVITIFSTLYKRRISMPRLN